MGLTCTSREVEHCAARQWILALPVLLFICYRFTNFSNVPVSNFLDFLGNTVRYILYIVN